MKREYNENLFFDNSEQDEKPESLAFGLESYIRSAAQRIIQAALELEVDEFLQSAKGAKVGAEEFRGYRNGHHKERVVSTAVGGLEVKVPRVVDEDERVSETVAPTAPIARIAIKPRAANFSNGFNPPHKLAAGFESVGIPILQR